MKIGILGGSFDPIHKGHIYMAQEARRYSGLDQVWLVPAGHSPNKDEKNMRSAQDRLAMCRLVSDQLDNIETCDLEVVSPERSYTYRTMEKLQEQFPQHEFYFIMGGDSLDYFDEWRHPEIIASIAEILVVVREGFCREALEEKIVKLQKLFPCRISLVPVPRYDVSSTEIRKALAEQKGCPRELEPAVYRYAAAHGLYGIQE